MSDSFLNSCTMLDAAEAVDHFLREHFKRRRQDVIAYSAALQESMEYSLFSGGKRFRPALSLSVNAKAVAWAAAVEVVHTYSLIHDDLPCMDNDDWRRGQPTNHKKFGEPLALLAGDALLTESFFIISESYFDRPEVVRDLVQLLSRAAGMSGMVAGQAMDMGLGTPLQELSDLLRVHLGKTAELISAALVGAAIVNGESVSLREPLRQVGLCLGLCFQIKDDLLDGEQDRSPKSYMYYLGREQTMQELERQTQKGLDLLQSLPRIYQPLSLFFDYNQQRIK